MKVSFSDCHSFERDVFSRVNQEFQFDIEYLDFRLNSKTAQAVQPCEVVCSFVSDKLDRECLTVLKHKGVRLIALRSAGFNHVDLVAAKELALHVCRVPSYSPHSVAEFALGLLLCLNRKIHKAYQRIHDLNFSLDGFVGFDLHGKTVGVLGAGKIGRVFIDAVSALGCNVLVYDPKPNPILARKGSIDFCDFETLCEKSDVISLHLPLTPETHHLIGREAIARMRKGVFILNTSRGAIIDANALISGLKSGKIGGAALDVYEEEENIFFQDLSSSVLQDDVLARLLTFPNVLITSHQAFLTREALENIARTTCQSLHEFKHQGAVDPTKAI